MSSRYEGELMDAFERITDLQIVLIANFVGFNCILYQVPRAFIDGKGICGFGDSRKAVNSGASQRLLC